MRLHLDSRGNRDAWLLRLGTLAAGAALVLLAIAPAAAPAQEEPAEEEAVQPAEAVQPELANVAALSDDQATLDRLSVQAAGLPPAPEGSQYWVWVRSHDLVNLRPVSPLVPDEAGAAALSWSEPTTDNLLRLYSQVLVTLEPAGPPPAQPTLPPVLQAEVDPGALVPARRLLSFWAESRYGTGSLQGLRLLAGLARLHSSILVQDAQAGNLAAAQRKAEQLINLVEGNEGLFFGDHNRDTLVEDPGDGQGLVGYAFAALDQVLDTWLSALDEGVAADALALEPPLLFSLGRAAAIRDAGLELVASQDPARVQELAETIALAAQQLEEGGVLEAAAEDGVPEAVAGLQAAYEQALKLVRLPLRPAGASG